MNKLSTIILLLILPATVMASGGQILSLFWLTLLVFIIVVVSLFLAKFSLKQKIVVFVAYIVGTLVSFMATSGMPYVNNMYLINTITTVVPLLTWYFVYNHYNKNAKT